MAATLPTASGAGERPQTYASPAIIERRRRILAETRQVIAEQGLAGLNMNDIGRRAGVAKRTLYNAFQTRERMIAAAIQEYFEEYISHITFTQPPGSLRHNLEWMMLVVQRNRRIPNYIRAIMALYFSPDVDEDIQLAMHSIASRHHRAWIETLEAGRQLQPWVAVGTLVDDLVRLEYAVINDWARGRIDDDAITLHLITSCLSFMLGALKGTARKEVEAMLKDIAENGDAALPGHRKEG